MESCRPVGAGRAWLDCTFTPGLLPQQAPPGAEGSAAAAAAAAAFEDYLLAVPVLRPRRDEVPGCQEAWAFVLSGALQYCTWLAYLRLGRRFDNSHMSVEYLLSCYAVEPQGMCGCRGADLPAALRAVAEHGEVTFRQFPFVSAASVNQEVYSNLEALYHCQDRSKNDTCRPCAAAGDDFVVSALAGTPRGGSVRFVVPCAPCSWPEGPRYLPLRPFHVAPRAEAVKAELRRLGPLCAALGVDAAVLSSLQADGLAPHVPSTREGRFYRPQTMVAGAFHAVLIVAYRDADGAGEGFWVCRTSHGRDDFGYTLVAGEREISSLFNVPMSLPAAWLLDRVLSFDAVAVRLQPGAPLLPPSPTDPFLEPLAPPPPPVAGGRGPGAGAARRPPPQAWRLAALALALALAAAALLLAGLGFFGQGK